MNWTILKIFIILGSLVDFVVCFSNRKLSMATQVYSSSSQTKLPSSSLDHDLWIVGAGTLGSIIAKQYRTSYPEANIVAETKTSNRHPELQSFNILNKLRSDRSSRNYKQAKNVVITLPPSSSANYAEELNEACQLWAGPEHGGQLIFTSSLAVYGEAKNKIVDEKYPVDKSNLRALRLIEAEEAILQNQGSVIRLAGLYHDNRGAHTYWIRMLNDGAIIDGNANGLINLLHYEDAAGIVLASLQSKIYQQIYIGCDDEPLTREEIYLASMQSNLFSHISPPKFAFKGEREGRTCNPNYSRAKLNWKPIYPSFREYMINKGKHIK